MNFIDMYYHWKIELIGQALGQKKCQNLKNVDFVKEPKVFF